MINSRIMNKVTKVTSPVGQVGKTTLATNLALMFAEKGYLTAVIELDRYSGTSPYLHGTVEIMKEKSLKNAIETSDEHEIMDNFLQSPHHENLFSMSLRVSNEVHDLHKFAMGQITRTLQIARNKFDKIFIDVPMNYLDNGFFASINFKPDQTLLVMDENIANWQDVKLYDLFLKSIKSNYRRVIPIVNGYQEILPKAFIDELEKDLEIMKFDEIHTIPYMKAMIKYGNEGQLMADMTPSSKAERKYMKSMEGIVKTIELGKEWEKAGKKKGKFGLFGKKKAKEASEPDIAEVTPAPEQTEPAKEKKKKGLFKKKAKDQDEVKAKVKTKDKTKDEGIVTQNSESKDINREVAAKIERLRKQKSS